LASGDDFNLREVTRALGIQNPDWEVRETVQPVLEVGSLAGLTPVHAPPTGAFRFRENAVVGEFGQAGFTAAGAGGTLIARARFQGSTGGSIVQWGLVARPAGLVPIAQPGQQFSNVAIATTGVSGTSAGRALANQQFPAMSDHGDEVPDGLWVPPGVFFLFESQGNNSLLDITLVLIDVPVVEGGR